MPQRMSLCLAIVLALAWVPAAGAWEPPPIGPSAPHLLAPEARSIDPVTLHAVQSIERGRLHFRYDPFGSRLFFSDALGLNEVLARVSPRDALALGVKVDADALPPAVVQAIRTAGRPGRPGGHPSAASSSVRRGRGGGRQRARRYGRSGKSRDHLRPVPLHGRRLGRARDRPASRRLGEPRPRRGRGSSPRPRILIRWRTSWASTSQTVRTVLEKLGAGKVRRPPESRRPGLPPGRKLGVRAHPTRPSGSPGSTSTPTKAGARSPTGTLSSATWR